MGVAERKLLKNRNSFACFPVVLSQKALSTEVKMFLLLRTTEIKDLPT